MRSDDESVLAEEIVTEGSRSPADVFFTENSPALEFLQERNRLAPTPKTVLAAVPSEYNSPQGKWVGVSARVSALVYNTSLLHQKDVPTSVLALANPKWKGKLGIAPSETDFQPIITSVVKAYGTARALKWLEAVKANAEGNVYPDNESLVSQVNSGRVALGIINHYYWYRLQAELGARAMHSALSYFAPHDPGYVLDVSGAAALSSSHHLAAANRFLAFLVSKKGERIIATSDSYEYPLGSKVTTAKPLKPFASLQPDAISLAQLGDGSLAVSLLERAGLL